MAKQRQDLGVDTGIHLFWRNRRFSVDSVFVSTDAEGEELVDKKALKREYKETLRPIGIFQIRNLTNDKVFVGSTMNLDAIFNRHRFQLDAGNHPSTHLQADWNALGSENFSFEILEEMVPRENLDLSSELDALVDLWLERLKPYNERGYNEQKKTREERLRAIASRNAEARIQ